MPTSDSQSTRLDREYLPTRAKILEIAAALDRIQRAEENASEDPRHDQLLAGIKLLLASEPERAEQVQLLFSRPYDQQWRQTLDLAHP